MAITSRFDSKCKDCGTPYLAGEDIDTNGNKSPNKAGEMKDHWCKMGKNCQGAMQMSNTLVNNPDAFKRPAPEQKDPTPEQFLELGISLLALSDENESYIDHLRDDTIKRIGEELIKRSVIEKAMNDLGLQHPSRIAFIKDVLR